MARRRAIGFFITPAPKGRWPGMSKTGQGALRKTQAIKNPRSHGESGFFTRPEQPGTNSWCRRRDSNSHSFRHYPLKIACLPISPRRLNQARKACFPGKSNILSRNLKIRGVRGILSFQRHPSVPRRHADRGAGRGQPFPPASQLICRLVALTTSPHLRVSLSIKALNACGVLGGGGIRKPLVW